MNSLKEIAERILSDLMDDTSLTNILLKAKIFATKKGDSELLKWIENELNGYDEQLPTYRILDAGVKVDIHSGFQMITDFDYPIEMIQDEKIRERLLHLPIHKSASEIEEVCKSSDSSNIHMEVPVPIWHNYMRHCINGNIQRAYQYASIASLKKILVSIKSLLIDYFLRIDKDETFDFATLMKKTENEIFMDNRVTYNAAIINTGSGNIHASNVSNVIGNNNTITIEAKNELQRIADEIETLLQPDMNDECKELITDIKTELAEESPKPTFIKRCLQALKGIATDVTSAVVAGQVTELIGQALDIL